MAEYIHEVGPNKDKAFYAIKLGALNEFQQIELINDTISSIKKGAPNIGTFFLDEISNLTFSSQTQLLTLFEFADNFFKNSKNKDVRPNYISSTSINLEEKMLSGNFREDLYYRLNVFNINVEPLNKRIEDIHLLINYFTKKMV